MKAAVFFSLAIASFLLLSTRFWVTVLWSALHLRKLYLPRELRRRDFAGFFLSSAFLLAGFSSLEKSLPVVFLGGLSAVFTVFWGYVLAEAVLYFKMAVKARTEFFLLLDRHVAGLISKEEYEAILKKRGYWKDWIKGRLVFFPQVFSLWMVPIQKASSRLREKMLEREGIKEAVKQAAKKMERKGEFNLDSVFKSVSKEEVEKIINKRKKK